MPILFIPMISLGVNSNCHEFVTDYHQLDTCELYLVWNKQTKRLLIYITCKKLSKRLSIYKT